MGDQQEKFELPPKPEWAIATAVKLGAIYAVMGAAFGAIASKTPILRKIWNKGPAKEAIEYGTLVGMVGGFLEYIGAKRKEVEYPLHVENIQLQNKVAELETERSFTQAILQEKIDLIVKDPQRGG